MEPTESLGDDSHAQWVKLEKSSTSTIGRGTVGSGKVRRGMRKEIDHMVGWGVYDNVERA